MQYAACALKKTYLFHFQKRDPIILNHAR